MASYLSFAWFSCALAFVLAPLAGWLLLAGIHSSARVLSRSLRKETAERTVCVEASKPTRLGSKAGLDDCLLLLKLLLFIIIFTRNGTWARKVVKKEEGTKEE